MIRTPVTNLEEKTHDDSRKSENYACQPHTAALLFHCDFVCLPASSGNRHTHRPTATAEVIASENSPTEEIESTDESQPIETSQDIIFFFH